MIVIKLTFHNVIVNAADKKKNTKLDLTNINTILNAVNKTIPYLQNIP